jgi:AcrR family transcriptional regulator
VARSRPPDRFQQLRQAALQVFGAKGLRRTRMADIAEVMGVAPGSLYNYVESKEALFHWMLTHDGDDAAEPAELPIRTPAPGVLEAQLRAQIESGFHLPVSEAAFARRRVADAEAELTALVEEIYERIAIHRRVMTIVERSAIDLPELFQIYFVAMRREYFARFAGYVERRQKAGQFRDGIDPVVAARVVVELVTYFARHRFGDQDPDSLPDDRVVRENVIRLAVASLLAPTPQPNPRAPRRRT